MRHEKSITMQDILFLLVNYKNRIEVINYIIQIEKLMSKEKMKYSIILWDNSEDKYEYKILKEVYESNKRVYVISSGKNIGYLQGAYQGYKYFIEKIGKTSRWFFISNTDLKLDKNFFKIFKNKYINRELILAPFIRLKDSNILQNPFLKNKPSKISINARLIMMKYSLIYMIYSYFFRLVWNKIKEKTKEVFGKHQDEKDKYIYAAHGSFFMLPKIFFEKKSTINYSNFLYGEEIYIAEQAREKNIPIQLCKDLIIIHYENKTTSRLGYIKAASYNYISLKKIRDKYF